MAKGELILDDAEKKELYPPFVPFFENGIARRVVILKKEKIEDMSKNGKPYTRVNWTLADAETGEVHVVKYDFPFTNALSEHKDVMRYETSVFSVLPEKTGERESKGNTYPIFDYSVQYEGEGGAAPVKAEDAPSREEVVLSDIDF
ncbi:MAG: hypothetical protein M0R06_25815 [Sphaerochaeta sp.]|jgi:hypothetical protein|nr:hypothetical protein [Sphaerochaeta sp.]